MIRLGTLGAVFLLLSSVCFAATVENSSPLSEKARFLEQDLVAKQSVASEFYFEQFIGTAEADIKLAVVSVGKLMKGKRANWDVAIRAPDCHFASLTEFKPIGGSKSFFPL